MSSPERRDSGPDPVKRAAILDACFRAFAENGYQNTDIEAVAREAGVGKGTVYRYFGTKEELFRATADSGMKRLESHCLAAIESVDDPVEMIRRGAVAYAEFFQAHPELVEILILERAEFRGSIPDTHFVYREKNREIIDAAIRRAVESGRFRDLPARETTDAISDLLYGTVVCACLRGSTGSLRQAAEHAVDLVMHGALRSPTETS